jgi:hypothetical protein
MNGEIHNFVVLELTKEKKKYAAFQMSTSISFFFLLFFLGHIP